MRYLTFWEPHEDGDKQIRVTEEEAIKHQRAACVRVRGFDIYDNDEDALLDYIAVNWASYEDGETV